MAGGGTGLPPLWLLLLYDVRRRPVDVWRLSKAESGVCPHPPYSITLPRNPQQGSVRAPRQERPQPAVASSATLVAQSSIYQNEWTIRLLRHSQSRLKGTRSTCPSIRVTLAPLLWTVGLPLLNGNSVV